MSNEKIKSVLQSKTFWVNVLFILIGIATLIQEQLIAGVGLTATGVFNIILRTITKESVKWFSE